MAYINGRGAYIAFDVMASADLTRSMAVTSDGSPTDLTGGSVETVVRDDRAGTIGTYQQTITDETGGLITFSIPKAAFASREGEQFSFETKAAIGGVDVPLLHGELNIFEAL